jgi:hypothetical protein
MRETPNIFDDMGEDAFMEVDSGSGEDKRHIRHKIHRKGMAPQFIIGLSDIEIKAGDTVGVTGKLQAKKRKHRLFENYVEDDGKFLSEDQHSSGSVHANTSIYYLL